MVGVRSGGHVTFQSTLGQLLLLGTYVGFSGTSTVVNALSRKDGEYEYVVVSLTLVTEVVKLFVASSIFYWKHYNKRKAAYWISIVRKSAPYAVPAAVYVFDNNLVFGVLYFLRPSEVALLSNISVITTALLFRFILHRMISKVQWCALVTLMLALMISRVGEKSSLSAFNWGHLLLFFQVICSSFGNIYTEKVLKRASRSLGSTAADAPPAWTPLSLQNTILYSYGVLFNFFSLLAVGAYQGRLKSLFGGWNTVCLAVVFTNATAVSTTSLG